MSPFHKAVEAFRNSPKRAAAAAGALVLAAGLLMAHFATPSGEFSSFWDGGMAGPAKAAFASCPTPKCLTVYVAPWCPHCREATPTILAARDYLNTQGVHTNVIVGMDKPAALRDYAKVFGPDTVLDEDGALASGGVPHFYVTDKEGRLLLDQAGIPQGVTDPKEFASMYGLP